MFIANHRPQFTIANFREFHSLSSETVRGRTISWDSRKIHESWHVWGQCTPDCLTLPLQIATVTNLIWNETGICHNFLMLRLQKCSLKQGIIFRRCLYSFYSFILRRFPLCHLLIVWHHFLAVHWSWFCMSLLCCRSWLASLWRDLTEIFSDNSSQSSFFNRHPHWLQEAGHHMVDAMATNLFDMFKVGCNTYNFCLWVVVVLGLLFLVS